jgi:hypothetical protein
MPKYFFTRTRILKQLLGILSNQIEDYVKHGEILSLLRGPDFQVITTHSVTCIGIKGAYI